MSAKVVLLKVVRDQRMAEGKLKKPPEADVAYFAKILSLDKLGLLDEMMVFQRERSAAGELTLDLIVRGQVLFKALGDTAETAELRDFCKTYRRHLRFELENQMKKITGG